MKLSKHTLFSMFCNYVAIALIFYFLTSLLMSLVTGQSYRQVLMSVSIQIPLAIFGYIWAPVFRILDMVRRNREVDAKMKEHEARVKEMELRTESMLNELGPIGLFQAINARREEKKKEGS
jgi:hypothetical protein